MTKLLPSLLASLLVMVGSVAPAASSTPPSTRPTPGGIVVASYNILRDAQRGEAAVVADLRSLDADVVCLQEVYSRPVAERLAAGLSLKLVAHSAAGQAILTNLPARALGAVPGLGDRWHDGQWADLTLPGGGGTVRVVTVHLQSVYPRTVPQFFRSENRRAGQLAALHAAWRAAGSPPLIVAGDFNQLPNLPNYKTMTGWWTDALAELGKTEPTFELGYRIDYILLTPGLAATEGAVVGTARSSDHRPLWTRIAPATMPTTRPAGGPVTRPASRPAPELN